MERPITYLYSSGTLTISLLFSLTVSFIKEFFLVFTLPVNQAFFLCCISSMMYKISIWIHIQLVMCQASNPALVWGKTRNSSKWRGGNNVNVLFEFYAHAYAVRCWTGKDQFHCDSKNIQKCTIVFMWYLMKKKCTGVKSLPLQRTFFYTSVALLCNVIFTYIQHTHTHTDQWEYNSAGRAANMWGTVSLGIQYPVLLKGASACRGAGNQKTSPTIRAQLEPQLTDGSTNQIWVFQDHKCLLPKHFDNIHIFVHSCYEILLDKTQR